MVTVFHQEKNTFEKYDFAYYAFIFADRKVVSEACEFSTITDGEVWIKTIKIDTYLANFERLLTEFKYTETTFEVTNALDRCRKGLRWACEHNRDYDALAKIMPSVNVFISALISGISPDDYFEALLQIKMITNFNW